MKTKILNQFPYSLIKQWTFMIFLMFTFIDSVNAQFVHPGITHNLSDLDRMKYMVEAGIEPWATTFQNLSSHSRAQYDYPVNVVNQDPSYVIEYSAASDAWFINDGTAAYYNALMWYITGDSRHADKAVEIFNTWKGLRRNSTDIALRSGRIWRIIEAAEIIEHTYNGWAASDIQDFKNMLVYPGYSSSTVPTAAIANDDFTFYWHVYNGDPARHGNQGLFAFRTMMAMAIFLDNEIMYDRALRYLRGQSHRPDDLEYPSGPSINSTTNISGCNYFEEYTRSGASSAITDYGYNEVISNYIFENGQSQESSRDQAHALAGVATISVMAEMAWNQGDDLYGHLDNRIVLGLEFFCRYNLSYTNSYPDQTSPWEPTVASGEYIERTDRSGRWKSKIINPFVNCDTGDLTRGTNNTKPFYEMNLAHYRDRLNLPNDDYKWLQRGFDYMTSQIGVEDEGTVTDHPGYGGLKFRRVSPGDPISGFDSDGLPIYAMNVLPMTIEAENYDYFSTSGEDHTYNDSNTNNSGSEYRTDEGVDIEVCSEGGFNIGWVTSGEYLTYTVYVPNTGNYDISLRYASINSGGTVQVLFDDVDETGFVSLPSTGDWQAWDDQVLNTNVNLTQGVKSMKVLVGNGGFNMNHITIANQGSSGGNIALNKPATQSTTSSGGVPSRAVDGDTDGNWNNGSVTHTAPGQNNPWWEVDLGDTYTIDNIDIYNRTNSCCVSRLSDFTVSVLNGSTITFSQFYSSPPSPSIAINTGGAVGDVVRVQINSNDAILSLAEVEVYGTLTTSTVTGDFQLVKRNATGFAIDGGGNNDAEGRSIELYTYLQHNNLTWTEISLGGGYYAYQKLNSNVCFDGGDGGSDGQDVTLEVCDINDQNQHWLKIDAGNGHYRLEKRGTNFSLDGGGGGAIDQNVYLWTSNSSNQNQQWRFDNASGSRNINDGVGKELTQETALKMYPNPVSNQLTIELNNESYQQFSIYNVSGSVVKQGKLDDDITRLQIDFSDLDRGVYALIFRGITTYKTIKIVKE